MTPQRNWTAIAIVAMVTLLLIGLPLHRTGSVEAVISFLVPSLATMTAPTGTSPFTSAGGGRELASRPEAPTLPPITAPYPHSDLPHHHSS